MFIFKPQLTKQILMFTEKVTGKHVLVVENDRSILELIGIVLKDAGYRISLKSNEKNMVDHINLLQPDAIILDILQPSNEGTELCRLLKEVETTAHIPIIVLSTHPKIQKVKEICADEVVAKPFDIDGLLDVLSEQLRSAS